MGAGRARRIGIIVIVLILVVVLIGAGALLLLRGAGGVGNVVAPDGGDGAPAAQVQPTPAPTVDILVAARDIPRGRQLSMEDLDVMSWPVLDQAPPPLGVIVVDGGEQGGLEQATGRVARMDILAGAPILESMITPGSEPGDLGDVGSDAALLVPPGDVAIAMPVNRLSAVAYALREGDHVDVLMSFRFMDVDEDFQTQLPNNAVLIEETPAEEEGQAAGPIRLFEYPVGREERGIFGNTIMVVPGDGEQAVQQTTQLVISNAVVMRVGTYPITDLNQPIVVTAVPTPTAVPEGEGAANEADQAAAAPTPIPAVPLPDIVTLAMSRQDALVLKYATEQGAFIDLALRSAADDDIEDIVTDPVTLSYIINARNVTPPEKLPIALDPRVNMLNGLGNTNQNVAPPAQEGDGS